MEGKSVRLLVHSCLMLCLSGHLLGTFAQTASNIRSGYAVVTLVSGNGAGLIATETLRSRTESGFQQAIVAPSVLVTTASVLVPVGPVAENSTAIAVANPSMGSGGVNLVLTNRAGSVVMNTTVQLGPREQFSKYLNEFLAVQPVGFSGPTLLTISSEIPVAILALNFRDGAFTAIPLTSLSAPMPVALQPLNPPPPNAMIGGFGLGVSPMPVPPVTFFGVPPGPTIGGAASLVFAQVAAGGVWATEIAVGNTSAGLQSIRLDFFASNGANTGSLENIIIPPRGVFVFSTDADSGGAN
jgi:hypothetical protein